MPWARGQGISGKLLKKVEDTAREKGYKVINLSVRETQEAAIKFYERYGYQLVGVHPHYAEIDGKVVKGRHYYKTLQE